MKGAIPGNCQEVSRDASRWPGRVSSHPRLLLLDEPFTGVDELTRERLCSLLARLIESLAIACVLVTHSPTEAVYLADRVIVMRGHPASLGADHRVVLKRPREPRARTTRAFVEEVAAVRELLEVNED